MVTMPDGTVIPKSWAKPITNYGPLTTPEEDENDKVWVNFLDNRDKQKIRVRIPKHRVPLFKDKGQEGANYKEFLSRTFRQKKNMPSGVFAQQQTAKPIETKAFETILGDLQIDPRLTPEQVFGADKAKQMKAQKDYGLFERVNARFWEQFIPFGFESDVPYSQDEEWTSDRIGELVGGFAGFGLSFAAEAAVLGGTSLPLTSARRIAKLAKWRKMAQSGQRLIDLGQVRKGTKLIGEATQGFTKETARLMKEGKMTPGPRGLLGRSDMYNDMLLKVGSGHKMGIGGKTLGASFKGNPKIANALDLGIRNMLAFQVHGQAHMDIKSSFEERLNVAKHELVNAAGFTALGVPKFYIKGKGAKQAWEYIGEPAGIFGIGFGWDDKDPQGNPISMDDRLMQGFGMVAFHGAMMGLSRVQIKNRMRDVMVDHLGFDPKKADKILGTKIGIEHILNMGIKNASKLQGKTNYWSKSKGKDPKNTISVSAIVKPASSEDLWTLAYNKVKNPNEQFTVQADTQEGLYKALRKEGFKPVNVKARERLMPPTKAPTPTQQKKAESIDKKLKTLHNVKAKDKYFEENDVMVGGKKVEHSRVFDPNMIEVGEKKAGDIVKIRNDAGKIVAYDLKLRTRSPGGTHAPTEIKSARMRFQTKKQLMDFVNKNWLPKGAVEGQIKHWGKERQSYTSSTEYNQWKKLIGITKKNAKFSRIQEKELTLLTRRLYPRSQGKLENLNRYELAHLANIVDFKLDPGHIAPPDMMKWTKEPFKELLAGTARALFPAHTSLLLSKSASGESLGRRMLRFELERQHIASEGIMFKRVLEDGLGIKGKKLDNIMSVFDIKFKDWDTGQYSGSRAEILRAKNRFTDKMFTLLVDAGVEVTNLSKKSTRYEPIFAIYNKGGEKINIFDPFDSIRLLGGHKYQVQETVLDKDGRSVYVYRNEGQQFFPNKKEALDWAKKHNLSPEDNEMAYLHYTKKYKDPETGEIRPGYVYRGDVAKIYNVKKSRKEDYTANEYADWRAETQKKPDRVLEPWETDIVDKNGNMVQNVSVYKGKWRKQPSGKKVQLRGATGHYIPDFFTRQISKKAKKLMLKDSEFERRVIQNIAQTDPELKDITLNKMKGVPNEIKREINTLRSVNEIDAQARLSEWINMVASEKFARMNNWIGETKAYGTQYTRTADLDPQYVWTKNKKGLYTVIGNVKEFNLKIGDRIDNITGLKTKKKRGSSEVFKVVDTYERDFGKVLAKYSEQIAHIVPTYRQYGRGGADNPSMSAGMDGKETNVISMHTNIKSETDRAFADWAIDAVRKQANGWGEGSKWAGAGNVMARITSNLGLSSPLSGWKNFLLGTSESFTTFGLKTFAAGMGRGLMDYKHWSDYNRAIGGSYTGSYELGTGGGIGILGKTGFMGPTEVWNRHFAVAMGRVAVEKAFNTLRTGKKGILDFGKKSSYNMMKDVFKFSDREIKAMLERGFITPKEEIQAAQMAHIITQGAPTLPFIPVWMSRPWVKPLTIFYRIGYRMTDNIFNNVLKPVIQDHNPMPLARYAVSRGIAGEGIYWGIKMFLGEDRANQYDSWGGRLANDVLKAELFGVFTGMLNQDGSQNSLFSEYEPAPIQIIDSVVNNLFQMGRYGFGLGGKSYTQGWEDIVKDNWVFANHMVTMKHNSNGDWYKDEKWLNRQRKDYEEARKEVMKEFGVYKGKKRREHDPFEYLEELGAVAPLYRDLKETFVWEEADELELGLAYWSVAHVLFAQKALEYLAEGGMDKRDTARALRLAKNDTETTLKNIIKKLRPLPESWHKGKAGTNEYYKFAQTLKSQDDIDRLKNFLDKYDKVLMPRLQKSINRYNHFSPWNNIKFTSYGSTIKDLKRFIKRGK